VEEIQDSDVSASSRVVQTLRALLEEAEPLLVALRSKAGDAESALTTLKAAVSTSESKLDEINAVSTAAAAAKTQIADQQAVIATKSEHIQAAQEHADKVRAELDRLQTAANQSATEADGHRARALLTSESAAEAMAAIRQLRITSETDAGLASNARDEAKAAASVTKQLAEKASTIEDRLAAYEKALERLQERSESQLKEIDGLLPGATSAGLAHAFNERRKTFLNPSTRWQWIFVASVGALAFLALTGLLKVYDPKGLLSWDELARLWLARLPVAGALIWLALYASRESALAKRLEEDYGYKAAVAASFQGFQQQMAEIAETAPAGSPISRLCSDTLATIGSPPGRIYEKHRLTVSPASELASVAVEAVTPQSGKNAAG
jgi:chaperonin cofactor prefoldin